MYTVFRVSGDASTAHRLEGLREDAIRMFGTESVGRVWKEHFACDVSKASDWINHENDICTFVTRYRHWIHKCLAEGENKGIECELDIAIDSEDLGTCAFFCVPFSNRLLSLIVDMGIRLEITIYPGANESESEK